jgi:hypothetical protein
VIRAIPRKARPRSNGTARWLTVRETFDYREVLDYVGHLTQSEFGDFKKEAAA